jgi:predicted DNA binding CopG/RHH family protein
MTKGRNTQVIAIRLPDHVVHNLKMKAKAKGVGYTVLARRFILEKLGFPPG